MTFEKLSEKQKTFLRNDNMQIIEKHITELKPYERNPRINDNAVKYVANSIKEFGWKVPIVIDKNNVIVAGHTRYKAALELNIKDIPCVIADDLTEKQIKAFRLADNKVSDYSIWDNKLLLQELDGLDDIFTGFDMGDISNFDILNEKDNSIIEDNEYGVTYEIVIKSEDKNKIEKIQKIWESMKDETENSDS